MDQFSEHHVSRDHLNAYTDFAKVMLKKHSKPVVNLYGGYWSTMLCGLPQLGLLGGVCHGLGYGEDRAVVPVGGGIPLAKYYLRQYHQRLRFGHAVRAIERLRGFDSREAFLQAVCECDTCSMTIRDHPSDDFQAFGVTRPVQRRHGAQIVTLEYPTAQTTDLCLRHYLRSKQQEFDEAASARASEVAAELRSLWENGAARVLGTADAQYLRNWADLLDEHA
jgi:hypothetical protein